MNDDINKIKENIEIAISNCNNRNINYIYIKELVKNNKYKILNKKKYKIEKTNSKLIHNFAKNILTNYNSYFLGDGIKFLYNKKEKEDFILQDILKESNLQENIIKVVKNTSLYGVGYILVYLTTEGKIKTISLEPENVYLQKDRFNKSLFAIIKDAEEDLAGNITEYYTYFTNENIYEFVSKNEEEMYLNDQYVNKLGKIPVIEFLNNTEEIGEITEDIITLIDAYNSIQSNTLDDFIELKHSMLLLKNVDIPIDPIKRQNFFNNIKDFNILAVRDTTSPEGTISANANYITKDGNNTEAENFLTRLKKDIYTVANIVDFQNLDLTGNNTILSTRAKLFPMNSKIKEKENCFNNSFIYFFKLLEPYIKLKFGIIDFSYKNITITFNRQTFSNLTEELDNAIKMQQLPITNKTILNNISTIKDVQQELDKYKNENNNPNNSNKNN